MRAAARLQPPKAPARRKVARAVTTSGVAANWAFAGARHAPARSALHFTAIGDRFMQNLPTRTAFLIASAIGATAALPILAKAGPAPAPTFHTQKCFGVAVAGHNDCGAAGRASRPGDPTRTHAPQPCSYAATRT